jgi:peroxiredoxin
MSRYHRAAVAIVFALALAGCSKSAKETGSDVQGDSNRKKAPNFSLKDANGDAVSLADYKGKVVLVNFWATWCGPCKVEIPWFVEFEQKYKDRNFAVLGISLDDDGWKAVRPYVSDHKINYRMVLGSEVVSQQFGGVDSLPTTFILDRQGRIAASHVGLVDKSDYLNEILKLLDDPKQAARDGAAPGVVAGVVRTVQP